MVKDTQAELKKAVALMGGPRRAARLSGINHSVLNYWMHISIPEWRREQAEAIIKLAANPKNQLDPMDTPRWALAKLKERRKRESVTAR